jgi:hypothetical protein
MPGDRKQPKGGGAGRRRMRSLRLRPVFYRVAHDGEIAAHQLERGPFFINFPLSPHAEPAEY